MKNQAIQYLALDVHQATTVATVRDESGSIRMRATVATEAGAMVGLVRGLGTRVHVAFEEGTQAQWLHDLLQPYAERVIVCNVRGRSETTNKSDRLDADWLSEMLRVGSIKSVHHGSTSVLTLKELVRSYTNVVDDSTRVMQRLKAIFRARAIATPGKSVYRASQRKAWLGKLESRGARMRATSLYEQLDVLSRLRPAAKAAMIAEARWHGGVEDPSLNPVHWPGADGTAAGHHGYPVSVSDKTATLALRRSGRGHTLDQRPRNR